MKLQVLFVLLAKCALTSAVSISQDGIKDATTVLMSVHSEIATWSSTSTPWPAPKLAARLSSSTTANIHTSKPIGHSPTKAGTKGTTTFATLSRTTIVIRTSRSFSYSTNVAGTKTITTSVTSTTIPGKTLGHDLGHAIHGVKWWVWIIAALAIVLFLCLLALFFCMRRRGRKESHELATLGSSTADPANA